MTLIEVMAKAAADWNGAHWFHWSEAMKKDAMADMRAALLALTEMEPTDTQLKRWYPARRSREDRMLAWLDAKIGLTAAANEGEKL